MLRFSVLIGSLCFSLLLSFNVMAQEVIIVNKHNPITNMSTKELKKIYNGNLKLWDTGHTIIPVTLKDSDPGTARFIKTFFGVDIEVWLGLWIQKILAGYAAPPIQEKDCASVISFVSSEAGAIGFVKKENLTSAVKVVTVDGKTEF